MAHEFKVKCPKSGREIRVFKKSFMIDGEALPFYLKADVPYDVINMLKDLLDDVYCQGQKDKLKEIKKILELK